MRIGMTTAVLAACLLAGPALAVPTLSAPFALSTASYTKDGSSQFSFALEEGTVAAVFILGNGSRYSYASTHIDFAPTAMISVSAENPAGTADRAQAHGELRYQYLVTVKAAPGVSFLTGYAYDNLILLDGVGEIGTAGPSASIRLTTSANSDIAQLGTDFGHAFNDASADTAYAKKSLFQIAGAGQYVEASVIGGETYFHFVGTVSMAADVYGETHQELVDIDGVPTLVNVNNHPGTSGFAYIDPVISINPGFLQLYGLTGGSVQVSAGVANGPAVPEPATWALLLSGFCVSGSTLRRRRAAARA